MTTTIYHNPRCSKSRQTLALLQERNIDLEIVEYLKTPPDAPELGKILKKLDLGPRDIMRADEAREAGIDSLDGDELISALSKNPAAIQRPIVVSGNKAALGRPPENVLNILEG